MLESIEMLKRKLETDLGALNSSKVQTHAASNTTPALAKNETPAPDHSEEIKALKASE